MDDLVIFSGGKIVQNVTGGRPDLEPGEEISLVRSDGIVVMDGHLVTSSPQFSLVT